MSHPSSLDLEAFACGDEIEVVEAHVTGCEACRAYVEKLRGFVEAETPAAEDVEAMIARAGRIEEREERAERQERQERDPRQERDESAARADGPAPASIADARRRKMWMIASSVAAPLAVAAALLIVMRSPPPSDPGTGTGTGTGTGGALVATGVVGEPETTFKGGVTVAVVRERGGAQARFASSVKVRRDDRLRVEVALDREQAILGGVLSDDGKYLELMPAAVRGPGTHFSEKSARIDAAPTQGTILIGSPDAVQRARETRRFDGVVTMRVEWEGAVPASAGSEVTP